MHRNLALLACAALLVFSAATWAHDGDNRYGNSRYDARAAYQYGYEDGLRHGQNDAARGAGYDYRNSEYNRANRGYNRGMGNQGQYKQTYREGYKAGYDDGYRRNNGGWNRPGRGRGDVGIGWPRGGRRDDGYGWPGRGRDDQYGYPGRGGAYGDAAYDRGYRDGLGAGREDREDGDSYSLERHGAWRKGEDGYKSSYGSKERYRQNYRSGYERGYREGYGRRF